jgi:hypothetical protein
VRQFMEETKLNEFYNQLFSDIEEMVELVFPVNKPVSEAKIRTLATILRKWLVNGDLQTLMSQTESSATFPVNNHQRALKYISDCGDFTFFITGGLKFNGRPTHFLYESPREHSAIKIDLLRPSPAHLPLNKFCVQPRVFFDGKWATTEQIIKYVANKLGGAHFDFDRNDFAHLQAADQYCRFGGPALNEPPEGAGLYFLVEPKTTEIVGTSQIEVICAAASFVQMKIDGNALLEVSQRVSLLSRIRTQLSRKSKITLVQR